MSQVTTSIASLVIPDIIYMTPDIVSRMKESKIFLEKKFSAKNLMQTTFYLKKKIFTPKSLEQN